MYLRRVQESCEWGLVMSEQPLQGKVAIVTGAGSAKGMGLAITKALAGAGARVAMLDVDRESLEASAAEVRKIGGPGSALPIVCDVSEPEDTEMAVEKTIAELGGLHILVNNAGIHPRIPALPSGVQFSNIPIDVYVKTMNINGIGPFLMARAAVGHMVDQGWGRIIGVTTSLDTMVRVTPYGPAKAAHEALTTIIARQVKGTGVTANVLTPGGSVDTNLNLNSTKYSDPSLPPRAPGPDQRPPEVMQAPALWMMSDEAADFNGQRIVAEFWDDSLPLKERLAKCSQPAGWAVLGRPGNG